MQSFTNRARSKALPRRFMLTGALALVALAASAPATFAWHGHLQVKKINVGGPAQDAFNFKLEKTPNLYEDIWDPAYKSFQLHGATSAAGPWTGWNSKAFGDLWAGYDHGFNEWVTYKVTEQSAEAPASLANYTTTVACEIDGGAKWITDNAVTQQYGMWSYSSGVSNGTTYAATTVRWHDQVRYTTTCTFTNRYRARVRVKKTFTDTISDKPSVSAEINGTVRQHASGNGTPIVPADTTIENTENTVWVDVPVGPSGPLTPVVIGESNGDAGDPPVSAYTATIDCGTGVTATLDAPTGKWTLGGIAPGQDVTCTIHNTRKPVPPVVPPVIPPVIPPVVPPVTPPGTADSGVAGGATSGSTTVRGKARLAGTVGCASARYAQASVSGSQIRRVTFYVNGRKVKTLNRANAGKSFRLRYLTKGLKTGSYAVRARVEFSSASKTSPRSYNLQFSRCAQRVVKPTFTG